MASPSLPEPGVSFPPGDLHASSDVHIRGVVSSSGGEWPDGCVREADGEKKLLQFHSDHRQQRHERGHGQSGWGAVLFRKTANLCLNMCTDFMLLFGRSWEYRACAVHHHPRSCGFPRPHRPENLLHYPVQTGGTLGYENTSSTANSAASRLLIWVVIGN